MSVNPQSRHHANLLPEDNVELDGDMSPTDASWILKRMKFKNDEQLQPVYIDIYFRDYLVDTALKRR
jgi:hypothetical protein